MKVLVFGRSGQVARELQRQCPEGVQLNMLDREQADLTDPQACARHIRETNADVVINAAAFTAVDDAETQPDRAAQINGETPGVMARAAAARGLPFLHLSTDYVFDGSGTSPWSPDAVCAPLGVYGRTKLEGERKVAAAGGTWLVLRTSWVFSAHGSNFVKTMLRLGQTRDRLHVVTDQIGGPTPAADIAKALFRAGEQLRQRPAASGVRHFSGEPDISWAGFARTIFAMAGLQVAVEDIPSSEYPTPARRPLNSRLDCAQTAREFGIDRPDWRSGLAEVLQELDKERND